MRVTCYDEYQCNNNVVNQLRILFVLFLSVVVTADENERNAHKNLHNLMKFKLLNFIFKNYADSMECTCNAMLMEMSATLTLWYASHVGE